MKLLSHFVKYSVAVAFIPILVVAIFLSLSMGTVSAQTGRMGSVLVVPGDETGTAPAAQTTPSGSTTPSGTQSNTSSGNLEESQILKSLCAGANLDLKDNCSRTSGSVAEAEERFTSLMRSIVNLFSLVVGVVAVFMVIVGGLRYITSGGDSSSVSSAKNTVLYVIVGLVVVAMAQIIVRYVVAQLSKTL